MLIISRIYNSDLIKSTTKNVSIEIFKKSLCLKYIFCILQFEDLENLNVDALNNTKKADTNVLFFNRVPKVGSQTFMELLRRLSLQNGFFFNKDAVQKVETIRLTTIEQVK